MKVTADTITDEQIRELCSGADSADQDSDGYPVWQAAMAALADPTAEECSTCHARVGWACNGMDYGYHAAGYHPARTASIDAARARCAEILNARAEDKERA